MSQIALLRTAGMVLVLGFAFAVFCRAADAPSPGRNDAGDKRLLYYVKHREAKELGALLGKAFQGAAEFRTLPASAGNGLLIRAAPSVYDEVLQALQAMDRPRQSVLVEVLIAEAAPKQEGDKTAAPEAQLKDKDFKGPLVDVAAHMEDLQKSGVFTDLRRLQFTAVEGTPTEALVQASQCYTLGIYKAGTNRLSRSIAYRDLGNQAEATAWVSPDMTTTIDLRFQDLREHPAANGVSIGNDENGKPVPPANFLVTTFNGTLSIPSGQAQLVQDVQTASGSGPVRVLLVVGARVVESDAKREK